MNYIAEINGFYDWLQFNAIPSDAQSLWHALMHLNNKCAIKSTQGWHWRVEFTVSNTTLLSILNFSRGQLDRMRNVLIQHGRIVYKKGKGNQSGTYSLIPLGANYVRQMDTQNKTMVWIILGAHYETQMGTQVETQTETQTETQMRQDRSTLINSNTKSNSTVYCGGDGGVGGREEEGSDADFGTKVNRQEMENFTALLFHTHFQRKATGADVLKAFMFVQDYITNPDGSGQIRIDEGKKGLFAYAVQIAAEAGNNSWAYLNGVLTKLEQRGFKCLDDAYQYDFERGIGG